MNVPALASSLAVLALGAVLLLDELGSISMTLGSFAPIALAAIGVVLIAGGVER